jgi:hypothetical protein
MSYPNNLFWEQLDRIVSVINKPYLDVLLALHEKLDGKNLKWVVDGDLSECMKVVRVEPDCIEIVTSTHDAQKIFKIVQEFNPSPIQLQTRQLHRHAFAGGKGYPVYSRSYYFDFKLKDVLIKVQGDLQFKVADWDWGDVYDFQPEYVYVVGKKIPVTPLAIKQQFYESLGWNDRSEKIKQTIQKPLEVKRRKVG